MGLFSFLGGLIGSGAAKNASRKAETAQLGYLTQALGEERRQFDLTRSDYAPGREAGAAAIGAEGDLVGLRGGGVQQSAFDALRNSPMFQSLFRTGQEAVLQNASATGGIRGGNTIRGLADFGADTFAQVLQQQLGNLGRIADRGMGAVSGTANSGDQITQAIASLLGQQGQVRAGNLLYRGGVNQQMWSNGGNFLDSVLQAAMSAGAGPGGAPFNLGSFAKLAF